MKRILVLLLALSITLTTFTSTTSAVTLNSQIERFDDGSYAIIVATCIRSNTAINNYSSQSTKTGTKTYSYYNSSGQKMWYIKVIGTFTYGNGTYTCTKSDIETKSYSSYWSLSGASAARSGATAYAGVTAKRYYNGTLTNTIQKTISLTCNPDGSFS